MEPNDKTKLKNRIDDLAPVLYKSEFTIRDLNDDGMRHVTLLRWMTKTGALEKVDTEYEACNKKYTVYKWQECQGELQQYYEDRNELPCGCRAHIPPERDGEMFVCKHCGDKHTRQVIKESL